MVDVTRSAEKCGKDGNVFLSRAAPVYLRTSCLVQGVGEVKRYVCVPGPSGQVRQAARVGIRIRFRLGQVGYGSW